MKNNRRDFLKLAAAAGALSLGSLALPRFARGGPAPSGSIKRVVLFVLGGGIRYTASFDGQIDSDKLHNPWGIAPWDKLGSMASKPEWGFARSLLQKPIATSTTDWVGQVLPYLTSDDHYNLTRPVLSAAWGGASLPNYADVAGDIAVVRVTGNPGGPFNGDHRAAGTALATGEASGGQAGIVTAIYEGLKRQYGKIVDSYYLLPPVLTGEIGAFGFGEGEFASSRPILLIPGNLPTRDTAASVSAWGRTAEIALESSAATGLHPFQAQQVLDMMNDKEALARFGSRLLEKSLLLGAAPDEKLGTLNDMTTDLTNAMLLELFGVSSAVAPAGDILFDAFTAIGQSTWTDAIANTAAFGMRLLQLGSPVVVVNDIFSNFDFHGQEVVGNPNASMPVHTTRTARTLAALDFALKSTADPADPTRTLWDSTVVLLVSEFGRTPGAYSPQDSKGGGSDHDAWSGWPIFGGPVSAAGAGGRVVKDSKNDGFFHQNSVYTAILQGMGVEEKNCPSLPWADYPPVQGLFK